jgi:hypothetical protein
VAKTVIYPNLAGRAALDRLIVRVHDWVVEKVDDDAVLHAPWETGELALSIHTRKARPLLSRIVVGTDHWAPQEYGAAPHEIRPRNPRGALNWPGAPHPVNVVHHPGNRAKPFMRPALYKRRSLAGRPRRP